MLYYKNRCIDYTSSVKIYRCLNRKGYVFSIQQFGKVVVHSDNFVVKDCILIVNEKIRDKIRLTKRKGIHAYISGYLGTHEDIKSSFSFDLKYNPYTTDFFEIMGYAIRSADVIYTDKKNKRLLAQI